MTGTAVFGDDYSQSGADSFSTSGGSITFAAGANTVFLVIDPSVDELVQGYQPLALALALMPAPGYSVASEAEGVAAIVDGDWLDGALGGSADETWFS